MKFFRFFTRYVLPVVAVGLLFPLIARAEPLDPRMVEFLGSHPVNEASLGKLEKIFADVTKARKTPAFEKEYSAFTSDDDMSKLLCEQEGVLKPDDGKLNAYANAKYASVTRLLKSSGLTTHQYYSALLSVSLARELAHRAMGTGPMPDDKRVLESVAFYQSNTDRFDKIDSLLF